MLKFRVLPTCLVAVLLLVSGCSGANHSEAPPVMTALDTVNQVKKEEADRQAAQLKAQMAAAAKSASTDVPALPEEAVPQEGTYKVRFETSAGDFVVEVHREWAPKGAQRFYELVSSGFYDECRFFRVVSGFMVQFGINGDPAVQEKWKSPLTDDKVVKDNTKGYITFATSGPHSRTTQVFINYEDNSYLDEQGFSPFGRVIEGMENVESIYSAYGERPYQPDIEARGNAYLKESFPNLDYVRKATIVEK